MERMKAVDEDDGEVQKPLLSFASRNIQDSGGEAQPSSDNDNDNDNDTEAKRTRDIRRRITSISRSKRHYLKDHIPSAPTHHFKDVRIVNRPRGLFFAFHEVYYHLISINWTFFIAEIAILYISLAYLFVGLYYIDKEGLTPEPPNIHELFFFAFGRLTGLSGNYSPTTMATNILAVIQAFLYVILTAVVTGVFYARFSKPQGRARFSKFAIISTWDRTRCLVIRAANSRNSHMIQAQAKLFLLRDERIAEGSFHARMYDLALHRDFSPNFSVYTWTIRHTIDEHSALYGQTVEDLMRSGSRIVVLLSGVDSIYSDTVHIQHTWLPEEILFDVKFADMVTIDDKGRQTIDFSKFDAIEPLPETTPSSP